MGKEKKRKMDDSSNQNVESKKSKKEKIPKSGDAKKKIKKNNDLVNNDKYLSDEVKSSSTILKRPRDKPKQVEADDKSNDEVSDKNKVSEENNENLNMTKKRTANESQQLSTETITEKKKKKKEKKKASSETDKVVGDGEKTSARDLALEYLKKWHENRKQWSFQKVRQVWILQHMYDTQKIPDEGFKILLEYMENSKGKARENTIKQAEEVIEKFEETDNDTAAKEGYMRARQVLQMLS